MTASLCVIGAICLVLCYLIFLLNEENHKLAQDIKDYSFKIKALSCELEKIRMRSISLKSNIISIFDKTQTH